MEDKDAPSRHELANAEQKISALKNMVGKAAKELDALADAECDPEAVEQAERTASQLRKAVEK